MNSDPRLGSTLPKLHSRAWPLLILGGVLSAAHIWKLAGALPELLATFQMSLVSAGVLFAIIQAASIVGGLPTAWLAGAVGVKRLACGGLVLLAVASAAGAGVDSYLALVLLRGLEGVGFLVFTVLAPSLIAAHAAPLQRDFAVGAWAMFQGIAAFLGLALTPIVLTVMSWRTWWLILALATLVLSLVLTLALPPDAQRPAPGDGAGSGGRWGLSGVLASLKTGRIWLAGVAFACYSGPWLAVLGFLPTVFDGVDSIGPGFVGLLAGMVGLANAAGALLGARLMHAGMRITRLVQWCFGGTALSIICAFAVDMHTSAQVIWVTCWLAVFSALGGIIAAALTRLGVTITPRSSSPPVTFGLMQQIFNVGNLVGPPLLAIIVGAVGGWQGSMVLVGAAAALGISCVLLIAHLLRPPAAE
ncbi:MFS transporter [Leucobacter sp. W1038]|uniref:MFS transporter n=1 Tax=Leucobacter sp. W1038 TaxID=3438281 RepID=UPI003D982108